MKWCTICCLVLALCIAVRIDARTHEIKTESMMLTVDDATGEYKLARLNQAQEWAGSVGTAMKHVTQGEGRDHLGAFKSLDFDWQVQSTLSASIHAYIDRPLVVFDTVDLNFIREFRHARRGFLERRSADGAHRRRPERRQRMRDRVDDAGDTRHPIGDALAGRHIGLLRRT